MKFKGKNVLITGASRGIGEGVARKFAEEGANLFLNYFVSDYEPDAKDNVEKIVTELEGTGVSVSIFEADVSDVSQVLKMKDIVKKELSGIDIIINNAGYVVDKDLENRSFEDFDRTIKTNLYGQYNVLKIFEDMLNVGGKVVNLASTNGINTQYIGSIDYDAAKAGIISLTKNYAIYFSPKGINVNAVAPGWVNTQMNLQLGDDFIKNESKKILLKRFAEVSEIVKPILFLCSDDSDYITGTVLVVDGGMKLI